MCCFSVLPQLQYTVPSTSGATYFTASFFLSVQPPLSLSTEEKIKLHLSFTTSPCKRESPVNLTCLWERSSRWIWTLRVEHTLGESIFREWIKFLFEMFAKILFYIPLTSLRILGFLMFLLSGLWIRSLLLRGNCWDAEIPKLCKYV